MADELRKEPGVEVEVVNGRRGELSVAVDGEVVAKKFLMFKPSIEKVMKAVHDAQAKHMAGHSQ